LVSFAERRVIYMNWKKRLPSKRELRKRTINMKIDIGKS
jgi:hypothetical protein